MMLRNLSIFFLLIIGARLLAQETEASQLITGENELKGLFEQLYSDSLTNPELVLDRIRSMMPEILSFPGAMEYPWSKLDRIGVKTSDDKQLRIFTWHVMDDPDTYRYFGYIQMAQKREKIAVFPLVDNMKPQRSVYRADQTTKDWYGKLYYGIITIQGKRKTLYTLLGMDFNDSRSNIKSVEVLSIQRNTPRFDKEVFFNGRDRVDRIVLEYSDQVTISVRYDPTLDLIAFDHLVPLDPIYKNNFEFYGPDGSFDGLEFSEGTWIFREDIDARMPN
ncbi:MAG: hypothetical protein V2B15_09290 [Bacteroidota bacterium]